MSTDFNYGNKTVNAGGPVKPSGKDMPSDPRARVNTFADIANIPVPYVGLKITVIADETNDNKMTDYIVKSLKANSNGIANMAIDEVVRYVDYLGASSGGSVSQEDINTAVNNYLTEHPVASGATAEQANQIQANANAIGNESSGLIKEVNDIKNTELQNLNTAINTLETLVGVGGTGLPSGDANIIASINRIDSKTGSNINLSEYQKKSDNNLTTTDKNIVGAINEIKTDLSNLVIESGNLDIIDYTFGCTLKLDEIIPVYGNIVVNKTSITGNEGSSDSFTVKLDSAPNMDQSVKIYCADAYVNVSSQNLIFTPTNYSTEKTITVDILENPSYEDWVANIKVMSDNVETKTITVNATNITEAPIEITSIQLDKTVLNLKDGETAILTPTIEPSNASSGYSWKSSANNIATVDNGTVRGIAQGSAVITCYSTTNENIKAECNVSVTEAAIESITLPEVATVNRNRSITLTPTIVPSNLTTYAWSANNSNVTVANGVVTGVTAGESIVTCYSTKNSSIKDTTTVTIEELPIESISINPTAKVTEGKEITLTPTITPSDATVGYTWSTNNSNVTVTNGVVRGVTAGESIVTCCSNVNNNIKATCTVTVEEKPVINIDNIAIKDESLICVIDARDGSNEGTPNTLLDRTENGNNAKLGTFSYTIDNGFTDNGTLKYEYIGTPGVSQLSYLEVDLPAIKKDNLTSNDCTLNMAFKNIGLNDNNSENQLFLRGIRGSSYGACLFTKSDGFYMGSNKADTKAVKIDDFAADVLITLVWDNANSVVKCYINGMFKKDVPFSSLFSSVTSTISTTTKTTAPNTSTVRTAEFSLLYVYKRNLTAEEISQNYNAYIGS